MQKCRHASLNALTEMYVRKQPVCAVMAQLALTIKFVKMENVVSSYLYYISFNFHVIEIYITYWFYGSHIDSFQLVTLSSDCKNTKPRKWCQKKRKKCTNSDKIKKNCAATCRTNGCCGDIFPTTRCKKETKGRKGKKKCKGREMQGGNAKTIKANCRRTCAAKLGKTC